MSPVSCHAFSHVSTSVRASASLSAWITAEHTNLAQAFELHEGFSRTESGKDGLAAAVQRPTYNVALMGLEHGVDGFGGHGKAGMPRKGQLGFKKGPVAGLG